MTRLNPFSKSNGAIPPSESVECAARIADTCSHPDVERLHATLDTIEQHSAGTSRLGQVIEDRGVVARGRRKSLERRVKFLIPESDIDPDDTGSYQLKAV